MLRECRGSGTRRLVRKLKSGSIEWPVVEEAGVETHRWKRLSVNTVVGATANKGRKKKSLLRRSIKKATLEAKVIEAERFL
jgi:hypothetical protein